MNLEHHAAAVGRYGGRAEQAWARRGIDALFSVGEIDDKEKYAEVRSRKTEYLKKFRADSTKFLEEFVSQIPKGTFARPSADMKGQERPRVQGRPDPTEIAISDRREAELSKNGFLAMIHRKNSDFAAFISGQSLQKPQEYDDPDATAYANLSARLPYLFATCRFAHYLKCIVRDKIGSFKERDDMQRWLQKWINNYVLDEPKLAKEESKARKPLSKAEVVVEENPDDPGYYAATFYLRPHYQLEGLTASLRLVSKLPSEKG